jgi:hypothetical protein
MEDRSELTEAVLVRIRIEHLARVQHERRTSPSASSTAATTRRLSRRVACS